MSARNNILAKLHNHWIHYYEEDTDKEIVFRPSTFSFPPSRGRSQFELRSDNSYVEFGIGPADKHQEHQGKWELDDAGCLKFYDEQRLQVVRTIHIMSVDSNRLVVQKKDE